MDADAGGGLGVPADREGGGGGGLGLGPDGGRDGDCDQVAIEGEAAGAEVDDGFEAGQGLGFGGVNYGDAGFVPAAALGFGAGAGEVVGFVGFCVGCDAPERVGHA